LKHRAAPAICSAWPVQLRDAAYAGECQRGADGLQIEGFVDGQSIEIEEFNAENDLATANGIARRY
jgi:hypothetical protein